MKSNIVSRFLIIAIILLLILHVISFINFYVNDLSMRDFFFRKFNFAKEKNVPSTFSSLLFIMISLLLFYVRNIHLPKPIQKSFWLGLSLLFLYLGFDELLRLHEKLGRIIEASFDTGGVFYYAWVIPYGIALIILSLIIINPFLKLPITFQKKFFLSGLIFVTGAVGLEMLSGWYIDFNQIPNNQINTTLPVVFFYTTEETMEMIGLSYFIISLLQLKEKYTLN